MKTKDFIREVQESAQVERDSKLWLKPGQRTTRKWPLCRTCGHEVDSVELKNVDAFNVELRATCYHDPQDMNPDAKEHEDFFRMKFPFRIDVNNFDRSTEDGERAYLAIKYAMDAFSPFDPNAVPK